MQGLRSGISKPPVPEQRLINRLHAEKIKRQKDAAEAKAEEKEEEGETRQGVQDCTLGGEAEARHTRVHG